MKREEIDSRPAESSRGSRASGSPCKPGEDEVEKRRAELARRDTTKPYGQYTNWCNLVKCWFKKTQPLPTDATPKPGDKKLKQGPWEKSKARILELETENKKLKGAIIKLRRCSESQSNGSSDTVRQETLQESIAEVAFLKQKLTESNKLKIEMEQQRDNENSKVADLRIEMKSLNTQFKRETAHMTEMCKNQVALADMTGYVRGIKEANVGNSQPNNNTPASMSLAIM